MQSYQQAELFDQAVKTVQTCQVYWATLLLYLPSEGSGNSSKSCPQWVFDIRNMAAARRWIQRRGVRLRFS
ncbi:MAG: hypothetical protein KAS38_21570 [Anaerolineales bacterium]|nr:hypothetical protein [Anaerolineales bacterium]MCK5314262.1 hypothetical protein [Anaerolineales bacterium]